MKNYFICGFLIYIFASVISGCAPANVESNMEKKTGITHEIDYSGSYDEVWDSAVTAASELNWDILKANRSRGQILFKKSYVYSPSDKKYRRTYSVPSTGELRGSDVAPYVSGIAFSDSGISMSSYTRENLSLDLKEIDSSSSSVFIDYEIFAAASDSEQIKLKSRGIFEKELHSRIETILAGIEDVDSVMTSDIFNESVGLYDIFFDFDSSRIREDAKPVLSQNAEIIKDDPELNVIIFSYADTRGTVNYNDRLARKRSIETKRYLINQGVDPRRLITLTRGETAKFAYGRTERQYQLNRRSHLVAFKADAPPLIIAD